MDERRRERRRRFRQTKKEDLGTLLPSFSSRWLSGPLQCESLFSLAGKKRERATSISLGGARKFPPSPFAENEKQDRGGGGIERETKKVPSSFVVPQWPLLGQNRQEEEEEEEEEEADSRQE